MLGLAVGVTPQYRGRVPVPFPDGFGWDSGRFGFDISQSGGRYQADVTPRDLVDPAIWTEPALHVDGVAGHDGNSGLGAQDGSLVHVNIGRAPGPEDIAVIRSFHGARFLTHDRDFYLENVQAESGITGALHFDAAAARDIVGVDCTFRYSAPSTHAAPKDAVQVRRTNGLVAFFNCDASNAAKDGWSFHEDGADGMHVLLQDCTGWRNGIDGATSCNGFTTHDGVRAILLGGDFGLSRNGTEVHVIQSTQTWAAGSRAVARDIDGTSVAFKCSNAAVMWMQDCVADADG